MFKSVYGNVFLAIYVFMKTYQISHFKCVCVCVCACMNTKQLRFFVIPGL